MVLLLFANLMMGAEVAVISLNGPRIEIPRCYKDLAYVFSKKESETLAQTWLPK